MLLGTASLLVTSSCITPSQSGGILGISVVGITRCRGYICLFHDYRDSSAGISNVPNSA
jgi:hypothetical protein